MHEIGAKPIKISDLIYHLGLTQNPRKKIGHLEI